MQRAAMAAFDSLLPDLSATQDLAGKIAALLRAGDVIALKGDLGVGKTEFARALLQAMGVKGEVPSPTFTILQTYDTARFSVTHFDLYRLKSANELDELGWDDALADGVTFVEWPERAGDRLPTDRLDISLAILPGGMRRCLIEPCGNWNK